MKIVIISDLHSNYDSLISLPEKYDELWVLGDLVDYGPEPEEVVQFIKRHATIAVCGNHDQAVSNNKDPRCSAPYVEMAETTRQFSMAVLSESSKRFLRELPIYVTVERDGKQFFLCHAMPTDPIFGYCPAESDNWPQELERIPADALVVGHTHTPFVRTFDHKVVVNPGSLGQPKTGNTNACYAIWANDSFSLRTYEYPIEDTIAKIRKMPVSEKIRDRLITVLHSGGLLTEGTVRHHAKEHVA